jgi:hypothetical protein
MALNFHGHPRTADMSGTIASGGTAQTLTIPQSINHEVTVLVIHNPDPSEDLWFAPNGVTAATNGSSSRKPRFRAHTIIASEANTPLSDSIVSIRRQ